MRSLFPNDLTRGAPICRPLHDQWFRLGRRRPAVFSSFVRGRCYAATSLRRRRGSLTTRSTTTDASPPPPCAVAGTPRRRGTILSTSPSATSATRVLLCLQRLRPLHWMVRCSDVVSAPRTQGRQAHRAARRSVSRSHAQGCRAPWGSSLTLALGSAVVLVQCSASRSSCGKGCGGSPFGKT